jgi:hypothetical protein
MKRACALRWFLWMLTAAAVSAQPVITDLQPRGVQKGRPFTLTLTGRNLGDGTKIRSSMPATFTLLAPERTGSMPDGRPDGRMDGRYATFLVEPTGDLAVGAYPIRVETPDGISNIQLLAVGAFPECLEDESRPGALANSNDTIETAQPLPPAPLTLNGALQGPERDVFRIQAKSGEKQVFEVEARRLGSAIDPVLEILDASGKTLARSEDAPLLGLDARVAVTFPREGYYYVVVHDSRYSTQTANFYRLKVGSYAFPQEIFPLGGRRGEVVETSLGVQKITVDLRKVDRNAGQVFVNLPDSAVLPVPFAVGDDPEMTAPVADAIGLPVTINARLSKPGQVDRYKVRASPGEPLAFRIQARELGTSKLMAVITVFDENGKMLGRSGDEPLAEDVYNVNQSRTAGDPMLRVKAPEGSSNVVVTVEDLALRGGPNYAYRLNVQSVAQDFRVILNSPFLNVPAGGSATLPVTVQRQGYDGEVQLRVANAPVGLRVEGGYVVAGGPVKETPQNRNSRGVLILTAEPGVSLMTADLIVEGVGRLPEGASLVRRAEGPGMIVNVAGASEQGSVDRQRPLTAPWLALDLPVAQTKSRAAALEVTMLERKRLEEGDQIQFRWKWTSRDATVTLPKTVNVEMVGAADVRVIDMRTSAEDRITGTFLVTTTKLTRPSKYDLYVSGRVTVDGQQEDIVSRPITVEVEEVKARNAETGSIR